MEVCEYVQEKNKTKTAEPEEGNPRWSLNVPRTALASTSLHATSVWDRPSLMGVYQPAILPFCLSIIGATHAQQHVLLFTPRYE